MDTHSASRAADFIQSIGVCAHIDDTSSSYAKSPVLAQMAYLGIDNMRVNAPQGSSSVYNLLGQAGVKFDVISTNTNLGSQISDLEGIAKYTISAEGPNEVNTDPVSYNNLTGAAAADAYQKDFYQAIHSDVLLKNVSVLPFSLSVGGNINGYGDVSAYADYGNVHGYASGGVPPYYMLGYAVSSITTTPGKQAIMTETGNYTLNDGNSGVTQDVQAKWLMDSLLENSANGVAKTYLYQLEDNYLDPVADPENHYGLYNVDGSAKQSATDIHNLTSILSDNGLSAATFVAKPLTYDISGLNPDYGFSKLYSKSDGRYDIALWSEPQFYNASTGAVSAVSPSMVTISFGSAYDIKVYDPVTGISAISSVASASSIRIALTTDPLVVEVTPLKTLLGLTVGAVGTGDAPPVASPVTLGTGPDTLALSVSEDAYKGDAQYTITIDNNTIGGTYTASASHATGLTQQINLKGTWGAGPHSVGITFLNDAYDGTPTTDRNLYVDQVTYDGRTAPGAPAALLSQGKVNFTVPAAPPVAVTLHLSEDAWQGDAKFSVAIDGHVVQASGTVTASNSQGKSQLDSFKAMLSSGQHDIAVSFLNDAYGGTSTTDRNLYVKGIDLNGSPISGTNATLLSNGTVNFPVTVT